MYLQNDTYMFIGHIFIHVITKFRYESHNSTSLLHYSPSNFYRSPPWKFIVFHVFMDHWNISIFSELLKYQWKLKITTCSNNSSELLSMYMHHIYLFTFWQYHIQFSVNTSPWLRFIYFLIMPKHSKLIDTGDMKTWVLWMKVCDWWLMILICFHEILRWYSTRTRM